MNKTIKERRIESLIKYIHERNRGCIIEISLDKAPQLAGYCAIYDELERIERGATYNIQKTIDHVIITYQKQVSNPLKTKAIKCLTFWPNHPILYGGRGSICLSRVNSMA